MCKANGSHPTGSCLSQSLGAGEHSGAGGDDIVHQQDAFAGDLLFIQNAVDTLQIGAPFCCAQGVLGSGSGSLFQKLLTGQMQLFGKLLRNQLCLATPQSKSGFSSNKAGPRCCAIKMAKTRANCGWF